MIDGGTAAAGRLVPWPAGFAASRLPCLRRVRVRSESVRLCVRNAVRLDSMWGSEVVPWGGCGRAGCRGGLAVVPWWAGGWWASA